MPYPPVNTKIWSCVGSAGVVDVADIDKIDFVGSVVKLHGVELGDTNASRDVFEPSRAIVEQPLGAIPLDRPVQTRAVVRFGITPNLFSAGNQYGLNLFGKSGRGQIAARLIWVVRPGINTPVGLTEVPLVGVGIGPGNPDQYSFVLQQSEGSFSGGDLIDNATYYVEATLSASSRIESIIINPPELAVVEIVIAEP